MKDSYLKILILISILVNFIFMMCKYMAWGLIEKFDTVSLKEAIYSMPEDQQKFALHEFNHIFDNISDYNIEILIQLIMLFLCVYLFFRQKYDNGSK